MRGLAALLAALPGLALAQAVSSNRVTASQDWSLFLDPGPICYAVSGPRAQAASRDGQAVQAQRGPAQLSVLYHPGAGIAGEVSFVAGYGFAPGSTVTLDVSGTRYTLFTEGDVAFAATPQEDARIVAALRAGAEAVATGVSGRGTVTQDTFSLAGFTAMVEAAARCGA